MTRVPLPLGGMGFGAHSGVRQGGAAAPGPQLPGRTFFREDGPLGTRGSCVPEAGHHGDGTQGSDTTGTETSSRSSSAFRSQNNMV